MGHCKTALWWIHWLHSSKATKLNKVITCGGYILTLQNPEFWEKGIWGLKPQPGLQIHSSSYLNSTAHKHSRVVYFSKFKTAPPQLQGLRENKRAAGACPTPSLPWSGRQKRRMEQGRDVFLSSLSLGLRGNSPLWKNGLHSPSYQLELTQVGGEGIPVTGHCHR